jgi:fucose 4-O-acetylase-like acetyltransferase
MAAAVEARTAVHETAATESARVQTLRGLACLLLVAFHVVGNDSGSGLRVDPDSPYRAFANSLVHLRMPLFTFLSGFVYAYRPTGPAGAAQFARRKLWRLFVPLVVVSTIYFVVQALAPGVNKRPAWDDMWLIYFTSYEHFWFLQAILVIFALVALLERASALATLGRWAAVFVAAVAVYQSGLVHTDVFSLERASYLLPFFLAGLAANRWSGAFRAPWLRVACAVTFAVTMSLHVAASVGAYGEIADRRTLFATALALGGLLTLLHSIPRSRSLAWIGAFSFTIYLYHVFFTAGARVALHSVGMDALFPNFVAGLLAGVAGPIVVELALRRSKPLRRVFLGQS